MGEIGDRPGAEMSPQELARYGVELCRRGEWDLGLLHLRRIAEEGSAGDDLPGLFYSYLGYGVARFQNRIKEGLALCEHSIKVEFYQPENYLNLARTRLLAADRRGAYRAVEEGLKIDPHHRGLLWVWEDLGIRRRPVLPLFGRRNLLNQLLGWLRSRLARR